jgi:hypothetical protein
MVAARGQAALGVDYAHRPLAEQLDAGPGSWRSTSSPIRDGGRYAKPLTALGGGLRSCRPPRRRPWPGRASRSCTCRTSISAVSCPTFVACLTR